MVETHTPAGCRVWTGTAGVPRAGRTTTVLYTLDMTTTIAIVRVQKHTQLAGPLLAAIEGRGTPQEAGEGLELDLTPTTMLIDNIAAARQAIATALAIKGPGRNPTRCIEFMFAGPPPYGSPTAWPGNRVLEWAQATCEWVRRCAGPKAVLAAASLDAAARGPYVRLLLVPISETGRLSWKAVERGFAADPTVRGVRVMTSLLDRYHAEVGQHFGLARG